MPLVGLYKIADNLGHVDMHIMVTINVFGTQNKIHQIYDLKGSTVGRVTEDKDKKEGVPLKDLDFKGRLYMSKIDREAVWTALSRDAFFLAMNNVMDYSLLLGIHNLGNDTRAIDTSYDGPALGSS